jgi:tetratricopeptide (TPR) repeat protein
LGLIVTCNIKCPNVELDSFLQEQIPRLCESRFALESFLKEVSLLMEAPDPDASTRTVSPNSLFGLFIKRCLSNYEAMSFESAGQFFEDLCAFCGTEIPEIRSLEYDLTEFFLDLQVDLLEKSIGAGPPEKISQQLAQIAYQLPDLHKRHYVGYLNSLRCGDFQTALTCLQRYFDYSIKDSETAPIQYTALNMAALYTTLEFHDQALSAVQKGMMYARDENDQECLSFLLCWFHQILYQSNRVLPNNANQASEMHILDSLTQRTLSQKQYQLAALCELKKAKCGIESGESPDKIDGYIQQAKDVIYKHGIKRLESSLFLTKAMSYRHFGIFLLIHREYNIFN